MATDHGFLSWGDEDLGANTRLSSPMTTTPRTMVDGHETFQSINSDNENQGGLDQSPVNSELGEGAEQFYSGLGEEEYAVASGPGLDQGQYLPARDDLQTPPNQSFIMNDDDMTENVYTDNSEDAAIYQFTQDPALDFLASQTPSLVTTDEEQPVDDSFWTDFFDQFQAEAQYDQDHSVTDADNSRPTPSDNTIVSQHLHHMSSNEVADLEDGQGLLTPYDDWVPISTSSDSMPSNSFPTGLSTNGSLPMETDSTLPDLTPSEEQVTDGFAAPMDAILNNNRWSSSAIADFNTFMAAYPQWMPTDTATLQQLCLQMGQRIKDLEGELDEKTRMALRGVAM